MLQLSWSHPNLGSMLATASYDGRVIVWKTDENDPTNTKWKTAFDGQLHESSGIVFFNVCNFIMIGVIFIFILALKWY